MYTLMNSLNRPARRRRRKWWTKRAGYRVRPMIVPFTFTTNVFWPYISAPVARQMSGKYFRVQKRLTKAKRIEPTFHTEREDQSYNWFLVNIGSDVGHQCEVLDKPTGLAFRGVARAITCPTDWVAKLAAR